MPALDRDPRPWASTSSKPSATKARSAPIFPALRRVQHNPSASGSAGTTKSNIHLETRIIPSSHALPSGLFSDASPIPAKSALRDTAKQPEIHSTAASGDVLTTPMVRQCNDGKPLWSCSPESHPSIHDPKHTLSSKQLTAKATPPLTAKVGKGVSVERSRQARSTEDDRLVEDARRSAAELIQRTRPLRPGTVTSVKKASPYVRRGRTLEREIPRKRNLVMTDSPKPHVGEKRSTVAKSKASSGSSPVKYSKGAVSKCLPGSARSTVDVRSKPIASKAKTAILPKNRSGLMTSREARPLKEIRAVDKSVKNIDEGMAKRCAEIVPATLTPARKRSSAPSPEDLTILTNGRRALPEVEDTTSNKPLYDEQSSFKGLTSSLSSDYVDCSQDASEAGKAGRIARGDQYESHCESPSLIVPVYRPKTRRLASDPRPISLPSAEESAEKQRRELSAELRRRELSAEFLLSGEKMERGTPRGREATPMVPFARAENLELKSPRAPLTVDGSSAGALQPRINLENHARFYNIVEETWPGGKAVTLKSSSEEFNAEQMSPIDLAKVSSFRSITPPSPPLQVARARLSQWKRKVSEQEYLSSFTEYIGSPLDPGQLVDYELCRRFVPSLGENIEENKIRAEDGGTCDVVKPLSGFDSNISASSPRVPFDSTLKIDKFALEFQPKAGSIRGLSPPNRPIKEAKHKRKSVNTIQWNMDLPLQLKGEVFQRDASGNAKRNAGGMSEAESPSAQSGNQVSGGLSDLSSPAKPQLMLKAPLSCLTNSHRGQKLRVSFASPPDTDLDILANFVTVGSVNTTQKELTKVRQTSFGKASHTEGKAYVPSRSSTECMGENVDSGSKTRETLVGVLRVYTPKDYQKASTGLRKAIATGRLLLEPSYATSVKPVGQQHKAGDAARTSASFDGSQLDDAVNFILDVKRRFLDQPDRYSRFEKLLETCHTEQITAGQAKHVDTQVAKLFADAPDLLQGFKRFRPVEKDLDPAIMVKGGSVRPLVVTSEVPDDGGYGIQSKLSQDNQRLPKKLDAVKQWKFDNQRDWIGDINGPDSFNQLVDSLRASAKAIGIESGQDIVPTASASKTGSLKFNPEVAEFKPLSTAFNLPGTLLGTLPTRRLPKEFVPAFPQTQQIQSLGTDNRPSLLIFARGNDNGALHAMGYHTMPTRTTNRYREALKKDLAVAENPHPKILQAPVTVNGTTYYTMPKHGLSPNPVTSLQATSIHNQKKDCRFVFQKPTLPIHVSPIPTGPRNLKCARDSHDPLWMYTPLIPIRKSDVSEPIAPKAHSSRKQDSDQEHGMETGRLDDDIAKMKLDDFVSRFPMTGRKAQVVPNMKQKYAAEIQHRLELVLYEKKEREAMANKLLAPGTV